MKLSELVYRFFHSFAGLNRSRPNLIFLSTAFEGGGAEYVSRQMFNSFETSRFILFSQPKDPAVDRSRLDVIGYEADTLLRKFLLNLYRIIFVQIKKITICPSCSVSHLEGPNFVNLLTFLGGKRVIFVHNIVSKNYHTRHFSDRLKCFLVRYLYRKADKIVAVSTEVREDLVRNYAIKESRIEVLLNPVNIRQINHLAMDRSKCWDEFLQNKVYVTCVGSFTQQKNHSVLLEMFKHLLSKKPNIALILVGNGPQRSGILEKCAEFNLKVSELADLDKAPMADVLLSGFVDNPYPIISRAKALILTSAWEGQPIVILEAMALGVPFLTTNSSPFFLQHFYECSNKIAATKLERDGVLESACGFIFSLSAGGNEFTSKDTWTAKAEKILSDEHFHDSLSSASREAAKAFDLPVVEKQWRTLFKNLN